MNTLVAFAVGNLYFLVPGLAVVLLIDAIHSMCLGTSVVGGYNNLLQALGSVHDS